MALEGSESGSDEDGNATAARGGKRPARRRRPSLAEAGVSLIEAADGQTGSGVGGKAALEVETARFQNPLHSAVGPSAAKGAAYAECPF